MAIDIEWQSVPRRKNSTDNKPRLFPRIVNKEVVDDNELATLLATHSNLSRGTVLHVLEDLSDVIASLLREGKEINLSSLGRLHLSLGTENAVTIETSNTTQSIRVRGINFQPSDTLLQAVGKPSFRLTARNAAIVVASTTTLLPQLRVFMQSHSSFTSSEFAQHFNLKRSTAVTKLNELIKMGEIRREGHAADTRYVQNKTE